MCVFDVKHMRLSLLYVDIFLESKNTDSLYGLIFKHFKLMKSESLGNLSLSRITFRILELGC